MSITIPQIEDLFNEWNKKVFNNELPVPSFELMQTKRLLGQFRWRKIGYNRIGYTIRISVYYDRPIKSYIDTIVHEMLHYYIKYKGIKDTSSHGRIWKQKAAEISKKYNLTITRTNLAGGGVSEAVIEKNAGKNVGKYEYVVVCKMRDGHYGAAVAPLCKLTKLVPRFKTWRAVDSFKVVKAPWAETYQLRHLRTACGVGYVSKDCYESLIARNKALEY
jgi:hypothetical protein